MMMILREVVQSFPFYTLLSRLFSFNPYVVCEVGGRIISPASWQVRGAQSGVPVPNPVLFPIAQQCLKTLE